MLINDIERRFHPPVFWRAMPDVPVHRPEPEPQPMPAEPELLTELRRIHEGGHAVVGHALGLRITGAKSKRGSAAVDFWVPAGISARINFMVALAAGVAAQRKFGADYPHFDYTGSSDDRQIRETAEKLAKKPADVARIVEAVELQAEKLVAEHWDDILHFARALRRLDDHADEEEIAILLRHVGRSAPVAKTVTQARSVQAPPVIDEQLEMHGVPYFRRCDGYLRAA